MLRIRQEQMDVFIGIAEERFEKQVTEHLMHNFPDEIKKESPESLLLRVKLHISTA